MISVTDSYGTILGFLDRSRDNCIHEDEWTPFQTQYFSENLVELEIEPGPLDL
jgi:hypothetical protein